MCFSGSVSPHRLAWVTVTSRREALQPQGIGAAPHEHPSTYVIELKLMNQEMDERRSTKRTRNWINAAELPSVIDP